MVNVEDAADLIVVVIERAKSDTGFVQTEHVAVAVFDLVRWVPVQTNITRLFELLTCIQHWGEKTAIIWQHKQSPACHCFYRSNASVAPAPTRPSLLS